MGASVTYRLSQPSADHETTEFKLTQKLQLMMCQVMILLAVCFLITPSVQSLTLTTSQGWVCGAKLAATCGHVSKRIVCGQNHCAQLSPHHAVLGRR